MHQHPASISRRSARAPRLLAATVVAAAALAVAVPALALIAPLAPVDASRFIARSESLVVESIYIDVAPDGADDGWWVDAELTLRNMDVVDVVAELAILDEAATTDATLVFVDGASVGTDVVAPRQDPSIPEHTYAHARRLRVNMPLGSEITVRVHMFRTGGMDALGRSYLELPTNALGLFADNIEAGRIRMEVDGRAIGLQATIAGGVTYDAPLNDASWPLRDWAPRVPFRVSWASPWSALLVVAEVEACPEPWQVVRSMTQGQVEALRSHLGVFDDDTLGFCANLPEVLHGRPFNSERTREQLAAMTLDRYVPGSDPVPLYVSNPDFDESLLSDAEAIYARALRTVLAQRSPE